VDRRALQRIGAAAIIAGMMTANIPACVIRIGPGGDNDSGNQSGGNPSENNDGQTGGDQFTPEEQAAFDNLEKADPVEASKALLMSEYTAYALVGFVENSGVDPATLDEATLNQLIEQYTPIAWQQAQDWVTTLDPSLIPLAGFKPDYACVEQYGCDYMQKCDFDNGTSAACTIVGCGKGPCPICPKLFDLSSLIVKNWCLFTCQTGTGAIVGVKIVLHVALFGRRGRCILLENPIP
jgi:hypothetical protein